MDPLKFGNVIYMKYYFLEINLIGKIEFLMTIGIHMNLYFIIFLSGEAVHFSFVIPFSCKNERNFGENYMKFRTR